MMLTRALLARGHAVLAFEDEGVRIRRRDGTVASLGLANLRRILDSVDEGEIYGQLSRHLDALEQAPAAAGEKAPEGPLVPRLMLPGGPTQPWSRPLVPDVLNLSIGVDLPRAVRFVTPMDLVRWGLSVAQAEAEAREELARRSVSVKPEPVGVGEIVQVHQGDGLDASRLLMAHRLVGGPGGALVAIPGRDGLYGVAVGRGPLAPQALHLLSVAQHLVARVPYPLTSRLFWVFEGAVQEVPLLADDSGGVGFGWPAGLKPWLEGAR